MEEQNASPKVLKKEFVQKRREICASEGCGEILRPMDQYVIDRPEGTGFARYDNRPKGPAGWRIGASGNGRRAFVRMERVVVCVYHALKLPEGAKLVSWPRKERFENLSKRRG